MRRALLAALLALACSGGIEGEPAAGPVADWSFVARADDVAFATEGGRRFRVVSVAPLVHEGDLYLHAQTIFARSDAALDELLAGAELTMRADGRLYRLGATPLSEAADIERVLPTLVREGLHMEATGLRWDPEPARYPGTQVRQWFFRLESIGSPLAPP